jgi:hypothetical protein
MTVGSRPSTRLRSLFIGPLGVIIVIGLIGWLCLDLVGQDNATNADRLAYERSWNSGLGHPLSVRVLPGHAAETGTTSVTSDIWYSCSLYSCDEEDILAYPTYVEVGALVSLGNCYIQYPINRLRSLNAVSASGSPSYRVELSQDGTRISYCWPTGQFRPGGYIIVWSSQSPYGY